MTVSSFNYGMVELFCTSVPGNTSFDLGLAGGSHRCCSGSKGSWGSLQYAPVFPGGSDNHAHINHRSFWRRASSCWDTFSPTNTQQRLSLSFLSQLPRDTSDNHLQISQGRQACWKLPKFTLAGKGFI